jgi:hypothetical protein
MRLGVSMDTLMRMQDSFDIAEARKREGESKVARCKGKPLDVTRRSSDPTARDASCAGRAKRAVASARFK